MTEELCIFNVFFPTYVTFYLAHGHKYFPQFYGWISKKKELAGATITIASS